MQYFTILHADKYCAISEKPINLKMRPLLTFIPKNKRRNMMRQILRQKNFVARHMPMVARENHCVVEQKLLALR